MRTCRGNYQGHRAVEGDCDPVAEYVFKVVDVDAFSQEFDFPRAGFSKPLRFFPEDKTAVLGLVSSNTPEWESLDLLKRGIDKQRSSSLSTVCVSARNAGSPAIISAIPL